MFHQKTALFIYRHEQTCNERQHIKSGKPIENDFYPFFPRPCGEICNNDEDTFTTCSLGIFVHVARKKELILPPGN